MSEAKNKFYKKNFNVVLNKTSITTLLYIYKLRSKDTPLLNYKSFQLI